MVMDEDPIMASGGIRIPVVHFTGDILIRQQPQNESQVLCCDRRLDHQDHFRQQI
ncbi:hypothetical protein HanPSC8_Chr07g0302611 [Helianthus annuus]|nr:hypothetical protein HanPSC8_Chr07g0302611 [Helianthus annuus]